MKQAGAALVVVLLFWGCSSSPTRQEPIERGWITRSTLERPEHHAFKAVYDTVQVDERFVGMLTELLQGVETVVVLGTWCPDSREQVPHFLKIADRVGVPAARIRLYAVDRSKAGADGVPQGYGIERVPTFIFLKEGKELGRIVETPQVSLEGDMVAILASAGPGHS